MEIKMTGIEYELNENGETVQVNAKYTKYENANSFNATVVITQEHLDAKQVLDDMGKKDFDQLARRLMVEWVTI